MKNETFKRQNLIALPINSNYNKDWIDLFVEEFKSEFYETKSHCLKHWEYKEGNMEIDFKHEVNLVKNKILEWEEFTVFAKSAGSLITLMSIKEGHLKPQMAIFVVFQIKFAQSKNFDIEELLQDISILILFIQKRYDPKATLHEIENLLESKSLQYKIVNIEGDTYNYEYIKLLKDIFIKEKNKLLN